MRRRVLRSCLLAAAALVFAACGTGVHEHALDVSLSDPSGRLGAGPWEASVFDGRMGRSEGWADDVFAKEPVAPGTFRFEIDYSGRGGCREARDVRWDAARELFAATACRPRGSTSVTATVAEVASSRSTSTVDDVTIGSCEGRRRRGSAP